MLSIINIQFGKNKNNTNKIKKVYNQGSIMTVRPQTAKYPYKILSIREFPKPICDKIKKIKSYKSPNKKTQYILKGQFMKKSFSFTEEFQKENNKKEESKMKNGFSQSSVDFNYMLFSNSQKIVRYRDNKKRKRIFSAKHRSKDLSSINNDFSNEIMIEKNRKLSKKGIQNNDNKKKVSSYSMSKYIEKYIDKELLDNNKKLNLNTNPNQIFNSNIYNNINFNNDDNAQIINFLSEIINKENYNKYNYSTTNNSLNNYNKNKNNTRNIIIKKYYENNKKKIRLSYKKNAFNEIKPFVINYKNKSNLFDKNKEINKNYILKYRNKFENEKKLKRNNSPKLSNIKYQTENNASLHKPLEIDINMIKEKEIKKNKEKEVKENINIKTYNVEKYKINNKYKRKFKFNKNVKIKNKKKKITKSHDYNNGFLKYVNSLNDDKHYINSPQNYRGFQFGKNCDIYNYLISPKNSIGITEEATKNDYTEFKSINQ